MIRGTTPTLEFVLPFAVTSADKIWITFSQKGKEVFTIETQDCKINETVIQVVLTQQQTLKLLSETTLEIQIRLLTDTGVAMASQIILTTVQRILKDGEIQW